VAIFDEILLRRDGVNSQQWPKLSCSQANELALEVSDLRVDANRKIIFYNASSSSTSLQIAGDGSIIGSLTCQSDLSVSGNLGIGTTTPTEKLEVAGKVKATDLEASGTVQANTLQITGNGNFGGSLTVQSDLSVSGNLGIGTTTPTEKLEVAGKVKATDLEVSGTVQADTLEGQSLQLAAGGTIAGLLTLDNDLRVRGDLEVEGTTLFRNIEQHQGDLELGNEDTDQVRIHGVVRSTHSSGTLQIDDAVQVTGNVGIGTTTAPTEKLEVAGNGTFTGSLTVQSDLSVSGNLGMGTSTPTYALEIRKSIHQGFSLGLGSDNGRIWTEYKDAGPNLIFYDKDDAGGMIRFRESPTSDDENNPEHEAIIAGKRGNVGIGTTNPSQKLEVNGNAKIGGDLEVVGEILGKISGLGVAVSSSLSHGQSIAVPSGFNRSECIFSVAFKFINIGAIMQKDQKFCNCTVNSQGKVSLVPDDGSVRATGIAIAKKGGW
jgi:cytoskeletal protein CcmA (bactofilin family)